jgi:TnpA family transposase
MPKNVEKESATRKNLSNLKGKTNRQTLNKLTFYEKYGQQQQQQLEKRFISVKGQST